MNFFKENKIHLFFWILFFIIQLLIWINFYNQNIDLEWSGVMTLSIFITAIWFWVFSKIDDTYIALFSIILLVLTGVLDEEALYYSLGQDLIWLLIAAFILAAGLTNTHLPSVFANKIIKFAHTPRQLFYYSTILLILSAFIIPATSGRAAIALPIFLGLAVMLKKYPNLVVALALLFPSVILLSAVGSYLGAGAHLITNQILQQANLNTFSFYEWFLYGFPFAVASSLICTELILRVFTTAEERKIYILPQVLNYYSKPLNKISVKERNCLLIFILVIALWFTETWHGISTTMIALFGALFITLPYLGIIKFSEAIKTIPWSLLLFIAATLGMGMALVQTQAMEWIIDLLFSQLDKDKDIVAISFVIIVILISLFAHLLIQSRSARSVVLIPVVVSSAPEFYVLPSAIAFISTAAAGFCHTLTSSAKPLAIFSKVDGTNLFSPQDLMKLSLYLAPLIFILICMFVFFIWPLMGLEVIVI